MLPLTVVVAAILAVGVPARWQGWAAWIGDKVDLVVAPISGPALKVAHWLRGARTPPDDDGLRVLEEENERIEQKYLATVQEVVRLRQMVKDLQHGIEMNPDVRPRPLSAPVFGVTAGNPTLIKVQAGEREGVGPSTVALAPGLQLIGRVIGAAERTCTVQIITGKGAQPVSAMIMLREGSPDGLRCTLAATGDGTLRGPVEDRRDAGTGLAVQPAVGQVVRLDDATWPRIARMLLIGRIERVEENPDQPLRKIVTVRPAVDQMDRLSEVILWVPEEAP
ncbi:hypothetical protein PHYC_03225 [Phycisphaerales bacterium]|nr:hypothetical protein PHYC_03225 [Phycisphaerales bacterium]